MKKIIISIIIFLLIQTVVFAQEEGSAEPKEKKQKKVELLSITLPVVSNYIFRGMDLGSSKKDIFSIKPALQPSIDMDLGSVSANVWSSYFVSDRTEKEELDEMDVTLNWSRDTTVGSFGAGSILYMYPRTAMASATDLEFYVSYGLSVLLCPIFTVYSNAVDNELYSTLSFAYNFEFKEDVNSFDVSLLGGYYSPNGADSFMQNIDLTLAYNHTIGDVPVSIFVSTSYLPHPDKMGINKDKNIVAFTGLSVSYAFKGIDK